jgi:hypothetical protein
MSVEAIPFAFILVASVSPRGQAAMQGALF